MNIGLVQTEILACKVVRVGERRYNRCMSKKSIRKSFNKSFRKSAEYSATLVFGILFLVSSMYSLPNFSATKVNTANDSKNLKTTTTPKLDSSYRKYCNSDDHNGICDYVAINNSATLYISNSKSFYENIIQQIYIEKLESSLSIRAPPTVI